MACTFCTHFRKDEGEVNNSAHWERYTGQCTRYPEWQAVTGDHYCSELRMEDASLPGYWRRRLDELSDEREREKRKRIKAEKRVQALRASADVH